MLQVTREGGHNLAYNICQEHGGIALHRLDQVAAANKRNPNRTNQNKNGAVQTIAIVTHIIRDPQQQLAWQGPVIIH
jgi:hypothetical protein